MGFDLRIIDSGSEKEGTSLVSLLTSRNDLTKDGIAALTKKWNRAYVKITSGSATTVGIVESVRHGPGSLEADPLLRQELGVAENAVVTVEAFEPEAAESIQLAFPPVQASEAELVRLAATYLAWQALSSGRAKPVYLYSGQRLDTEVVQVVPGDFCIVTPATNFTITGKKSSAARIGFQHIGGLDREIQMLRERIIWPLMHKESFSSLGIRIPRGILLWGPPGCGKTLLARALAGELGIQCFEMRGPEVFAGVYGESEKRIRDIFAEAREKSPALILIDEIDALAPSRQNTRGELERRLVTMLLSEMDGLRDGGEVIVVATTNEVNTLDVALRRPGRFDFELSIGAPDAVGRLQILKIHSRHMPIEGVRLEDIALRGHGFSGADLMSLCRESAFVALKKVLGSGDPSSVDPVKLRAAKITTADFEEALKTLRPSALREFAVEVPTDLSWDDVGGLRNIKDTFMEEIVRAIANPEVYSRMGVSPVRGVLLYGPPGTGKTLLARVIANKAGSNFISIRGPEILSKWVGESEQRIRQLFERARQVSPCIIFFDEIDALTSARGQGTNEVGDRIVNQLLTEMDGFQTGKQVCVIAATNRKDIIDPALLRPGRFDYAFEVGLPGPEEREDIFVIHLKNKPTAKDINVVALAKDSLTEGFSGAHISEACRRAALEALRENQFVSDGAFIKQRHLLNGIATVRGNIENLEKKIRRIGF